MAPQLQNQFSFDPSLVAAAVAVPTGAFVEVDDLAFAENGLGRRVAQTSRVTLGERDVSVMYGDGDDATYELLLGRDNPETMGTYPQLQAAQPAAIEGLTRAFGGLGRFSIHEMVVALRWLGSNPGGRPTDAVAHAREYVRRGSWVIANRYEAMAMAPVDWKALGL